MARAWLLSASLWLIACNEPTHAGDDQPVIDADTGGFDRQAMLAHLVDDLEVPAHDAFAVSAHALAGAVDAHCDALTPTSLETARGAWRDAIDRWERIDAVLVGPGAAEMRTLRDRIYAWPLAATCGVDREVPAAWANPGAYDVTTKLTNVRSLAAIEYLLFNDSTQHTCAADPNGWAALGDDLPAARCTLAAKLAADVAAAADLAVDGWAAARADLVDGPSIREAVNRVSDALFYVDSMVKDMKLGEAAGISVNACGAVEAPCLREVEHRFADHATAAVRINLRALREAFTGTTETVDGPGFDDHLRAVGATALADRMTASLDAAIALADALPDSFLAALDTQRDDVVALHAAIKAFTDDLKSELLTVLGLDIPDDVAGDND